MISINDLTKNEINAVKDSVRRSPTYIRKANEYKQAIIKCNTLRSYSILAEMSKMEKEAIQEYISKKDKEKCRMLDLMKDMEQHDIDIINDHINGIIFMADVIEAFAMEVNSVLNKYFPDMKVTMYDKIIELGKAAKEQRQFMDNVTEEIYKNSFGDLADKLQEMVLNKARALSKKIRAKKELKDKIEGKC